jgi:phytoene/squalene synthetase
MTPTAAAPDTTWTRDAAFRYCERLARTHYENFTVGSWLLPRAKRRHVYTIYGYCRTVDDLGDEAVPPTLPAPAGGKAAAIGGGAEAHRLDLLDRWQTELEACYAGTPSHPVLVALQETIERFDIPPEPFLKLIDANRMDQRDQRHPTYRDLLYYCDHSANPVGHLFL